MFAGGQGKMQSATSTAPSDRTRGPSWLASTNAPPQLPTTSTFADLVGLNDCPQSTQV